MKNWFVKIFGDALTNGKVYIGVVLMMLLYLLFNWNGVNEESGWNGTSLCLLGVLLLLSAFWLYFIKSKK
jgi:hypothetical protein